MIIHGVTFNEEVIKDMKKRDFMDMHKDVFFLDKPSQEREMLLSDIYDKIKGDKPATMGAE